MAARRDGWVADRDVIALGWMTLVLMIALCMTTSSGALAQCDPGICAEAGCPTSPEDVAAFCSSPPDSHCRDVSGSTICADGNLSDEIEAMFLGSLLTGRKGYLQRYVDSLPLPNIEFDDDPWDVAEAVGLIPCLHDGQIRTPFNHGKVTVVYLLDSDECIESGCPRRCGVTGPACMSDTDCVPMGQPVVNGLCTFDDSLFYVGIDIANGDTYSVPGDPLVVDVDMNDCLSLCLCGLPDYCPPGGDGQIDYLMVPFDTDGDGCPCSRNRFDLDCDGIDDFPLPGLEDTALAEEYGIVLRDCEDTNILHLAIRMNTFIAPHTVKLFVNDLPAMLSEVERYLHFPREGTTEQELFCRGHFAHQAHTLTNPPPSIIGCDHTLDVEFLVPGIDTVVRDRLRMMQPPMDPPLSYSDARLKIAEGNLRVFSDSNNDKAGGAEDGSRTDWFIPIPEIEVTKQVRCCEDISPGEPGVQCPSETIVPFETTVEAVPGATLEFKIEVENTGNVPLAVALEDILEEVNVGAELNVDLSSLSATHCRQDANGVCVRQTDVTPFNAQSCPMGCSTAECDANTWPCIRLDLNPVFFTTSPPVPPEFFDGFLEGVQQGGQRFLGVLLPVEVCSDPVHRGDKMTLIFRGTVKASDAFCAGPREDIDIRNSITAIGDPDIPAVIQGGSLNPPDGDEARDCANCDPGIPGGCPSGCPQPGTMNGVDTPCELMGSSPDDPCGPNPDNPPNTDDNVVTANILCTHVDLCKQVQTCVTDPGVPCAAPPDEFSACDGRLDLNEAPAGGIDLRYRYRVTNDGELDLAIRLTDLFLCADIAALPGVDIVPNQCPLCATAPVTLPPPGQIVDVIPAGQAMDYFCRIQIRDPDMGGPLTAQDALEGLLLRDDGRDACSADEAPDSPNSVCYRNCANVDGYSKFIRDPHPGGNDTANSTAQPDDEQIIPPLQSISNLPRNPGQVVILPGADLILQTPPGGDDLSPNSDVCGGSLDADDSHATICVCQLSVDKKVRCIESGSATNADVCLPGMAECTTPTDVELDVQGNSAVQFYSEIRSSPDNEAVCLLQLTDTLTLVPAEINPLLITARIRDCANPALSCVVPGFRVDGQSFTFDPGPCDPVFPTNRFEPGQCIVLTFNATIPANANPAPFDPVNTLKVDIPIDCSTNDFACSAMDSVGIDILPQPMITVTKDVQCLDGCLDTTPGTAVDPLEAVPGAHARFRIQITNPPTPDMIPIGEICITDLLDCPSWLCPGGLCGPTGTLQATVGGTNVEIDVCGTPANPNDDHFGVDGVERCFRLNSRPNGWLASGETLTISFDVQVPMNAPSNAMCQNNVIVKAARGEDICPPNAPVTVNTDAKINVNDTSISLCKQVRLFPDGTYPPLEGCLAEGGNGNQINIPEFSPGPQFVEYRFAVRNVGELEEAIVLDDLQLCTDLNVAPGVAFVTGQCDICQGGVGQIVDTIAPGETKSYLCRVQFDTFAAATSFMTRDDDPTDTCRALIPGTPNPDPQCYKNCAHVDAYSQFIRDPAGAAGNNVANTTKAAGSDDVQVVMAGQAFPIWNPGQVVILPGTDPNAPTGLTLQTVPAPDDLSPNSNICGGTLETDDSDATICICQLTVDKRVRCIESGDPTNPNVCLPGGGECTAPTDAELDIQGSSAVQFYSEIRNSPDNDAVCLLYLTDTLTLVPAEINPLLTTARIRDCVNPTLSCVVPGFRVDGQTFTFDPDLCPPVFPTGRFEPGQCIALTFNATIPANANPAPLDPANTLKVDIPNNCGSTDPACSAMDAVAVDLLPQPVVTVSKDVQCLDGCLDTTPGTAVDPLEAVPGAYARFRIQITNPPAPNTVPIGEICITDLLDCPCMVGTPNCQPWLCPGGLCGPTGTLQATVGATSVEIDVCGAPANPNDDHFGVDGDERCFRLNSRPNGWLAPGETLTISFDVSLPMDATSNEMCQNNVIVKAARGEDICPPNAPVTVNTDAKINVTGGSVDCDKSATATLGNGQVINSVNDAISINTGSNIYPFSITYRATATNNGELPLQMVRLCDPDLVADAMSVPGVMISNCDFDDTPDGCKFVLPTVLAPGMTSNPAVCTLTFYNEAQWLSFAGKDDDGSEDCYLNEVTVYAQAAVPGTVCGNNSPVPPRMCSLTVCVQPCPSCPRTKAKFDIWNENEVRFSGTERCIQSWDQEWLSQYTTVGIANHFFRFMLQTDKGKARIDGLRSPVVCPPETPLDPESIPMPLLGVKSQRVALENSEAFAMTGTSLVGIGLEDGVITHDLPTDGEESTLPDWRDRTNLPATVAPVLPVYSHIGDANPFPSPSESSGASIDKRVDISTKGSLLLYAKVEIKWDASGTVIQDTFVSLSNDNDAPVDVQLYFVNGDQPLAAVLEGDPPMPTEREHMGCNRSDAVVPLTEHESTYWSTLTGLPAGVSPFTVLDPGVPPGRPDLDPFNVGGRVLRGYVLAWAVEHGSSIEINWNHLHGSATIVNYRDATAWEYPIWAFQAVADVGTGERLLEDFGVLDLNGVEYESTPSQLVFDFYAIGAFLESASGVGFEVVDTDLTLWGAIKDLRQDCPPPQP